MRRENYPFNGNTILASQNDLTIVENIEQADKNKPEKPEKPPKRAKRAKPPKYIPLKLNTNTKEAKKILLLGTASVGKSTIFKQLQFIYGGSYDNEERNSFKGRIYGQIIDQMHHFLDVMDSCDDEMIDHNGRELDLNNLNFPSDLAENAAQIVRSVDSSRVMDSHLAKQIDILWNEEAILKVFEHRGLFAISDSCKYFYDDIFRFVKKKYIPNDLDIGYDTKKF